MPSLNIYVTKEEKEQLKELARKLNMSVSDLVTSILDGKIKVELPDVHKIS